MNNANDEEFLIGLIVVMAVIVVVALTIKVFYLLTISKCLQRIHPRNRRMSPGQVWLDLIPCFNMIWGFIIVNRLADSLADEFYDRRLDRRGDDYGRPLGTWFMICLILGRIPYIGVLFSIAFLVMFIIYWVKIAGYSKELFEDGDTDYGDYDGGAE